MMQLVLLIGVMLLVGIVGGVSGVAWLRQRARFLALREYNRGVALLEAGQTSPAIQAFQAALRRQPALLSARYGMGLAYLKDRRFLDAIKLLEAVLPEKPNDAMVYCNLGWAYLSIGRLEDARVTLEKGARINARVKELYFNLSRVFREKGDREQAIHYCRRALEIDPAYLQAQHDLNELAEIRYDAALNMELLQQALQHFDDNNTDLMIRLERGGA